MKRGTPNLIKFRKLSRALGWPQWKVVGLLESLWAFATENSPNGDIGKFDDETILLAIEYEDDEDVIEALVATGWIDKDEDHRLIIHDWQDHCPQSVKRRINRRLQPKATKTKSQPETTKPDPPAADSTAFSYVFIRKYPRKDAVFGVSKHWGPAVVALQAYADANPDIEIGDPNEFIIEKASEYAASPAGRDPKPGKTDYRPYPGNWLRDGHFLDNPHSWQQGEQGTGDADTRDMIAKALEASS